VRTFLSTVALGALLSTGCAGHMGSSASFSAIPTSNRPVALSTSTRVIVTQDTLLVGKVTKVNLEGHFVVLTFPIGHLPALEQRLNLYRHGLKTGEVRVTGPQLDDNIVGDIIVGEAEPGDDVRSQ